MDTHVVHSRVEGHGEDEDHHEKKSVLKKVKAKAMKLKETITGHHHGHEEGHHTPDDHDLDEEDDEEVDDPEVHGAPIYDSVRRTDAPVQGDVLKVPMVKFGDTRAGRDEYDPVVSKSNVNVTDPIRSNAPGLHGTTGHGATHKSGATRRTDAPGQGGIHFGETRHEADPAAPRERTSVGFSGPVSDFVPGQNRMTTGHEDHLLGGARTKLAGPTTGPLLKHEEQKAFGGGTHAPRNTSVSSVPHHGIYDATTMDLDSLKTSGSGQEAQLDAYRGKLGKTDVLGEATPMPQSATLSSLAHGTHKSSMDVDPRQTFVSGQGEHNSDQSKVNLDLPRGLEEDPHAPKSNPQAYTPSNYETNVTDPTKSGGQEIGITPVLRSFDKMNLHGDDRQYLNNSANQKMSTGSHDQVSPDKPSNQGSSYTEKFSSATSAIADKAISAKNVVASKLGYGASDQVHDNRDVGVRPNVQPASISTDQHGKTITSTVVEKLTPVYEMVAGAGTTVMSKIQGGSTASTDRDTNTVAGNQAGDKGVSVKHYFVEKLRPGDEDRALSEVISEKLQIHKPGVKEQTGQSASGKPMGKVTESEEVRQRLGNTRNENFVVEKIKDTVGSMLGGINKNDDERQEGLSSSADSGGEDRRGVCVAEHRRLQEN